MAAKRLSMRAVFSLIDWLTAWPRAGWILLLAATGSMATALIAQYGFDLQPCVLCLAQRGPYIAVLGLAVLGLFLRRRVQAVKLILGVCLAAFVVGGGIAVFHTGVEQHWWMGTQGCAVGGEALADSAASLREQLLAKAVARCDVISWTFLGLSMTVWNVFLSLALSVYAFLVLRRIGGYGRLS